VSRAELRKAFRELRAGAEKGFEQRNDALAKFLADRFNLSADDVAKALNDLPRPQRPGHGGRLGPGGPERGPGPGPGLAPGGGPGLAAPGMYPAPVPG
jgi:hypothetical protein